MYMIPKFKKKIWDSKLSYYVRKLAQIKVFELLLIATLKLKSKATLII